MKPRIVSEEELDREFNVKARLASGGDYGCHCAVFDGDVDLSAALAFEDNWFYALNDAATPHDIGTVVFTGNVRCKDASVSDRLMCLIVLGNLTVDRLDVFATEMLVAGDLEVGALSDRDAHLTVLGARRERATT